ncbi:MAG: hypothetical protein ACPGVN_06445 [Alphaproteobacteria bacterium]
MIFNTVQAFLAGNNSDTCPRGTITKVGGHALSCLAVAVALNALASSPVSAQAGGSQMDLHAQQQMQAAGGSQLILDLGAATPSQPQQPPMMPQYVRGPNGQMISVAPQTVGGPVPVPQPMMPQPMMQQGFDPRMPQYQPVRPEVMAAGRPTIGQWQDPNQPSQQPAYNGYSTYDPRPTVGMQAGIPYQPYQPPRTVFAAPQPPRIMEPNPQEQSESNLVYSSPMYSSKVTGATGAENKVHTTVSVPARYGNRTTDMTSGYTPVTLGQPTSSNIGNAPQARVVQLSGPSVTSTSTVPAGQILIPSNLQSSGPIIPPNIVGSAQTARVTTPTQPAPVAAPDLYDDLTLNTIPDNGSLIDGIPDIGDEAIEDFDNAPTDDGRFSMGVAVNLNGAGAMITGNASALPSTYGASVDLGYKVVDSAVGRVQFTYDQFKIKAKDFDDAAITDDVKGQVFSLYLLADWHPFQNGFRMTAGPGTTLLKYDGATSYETQFSPYVGLGYDSSLFSPSKFSVWADLGATYYKDKTQFTGTTKSKMNFFPSANLGVKYRF